VFVGAGVLVGGTGVAEGARVGVARVWAGGEAGRLAGAVDGVRPDGKMALNRTQARASMIRPPQPTVNLPRIPRFQRRVMRCMA